VLTLHLLLYWMVKLATKMYLIKLAMFKYGFIIHSSEERERRQTHTTDVVRHILLDNLRGKLLPNVNLLQTHVERGELRMFLLFIQAM